MGFRTRELAPLFLSPSITLSTDKATKLQSRITCETIDIVYSWKGGRGGEACYGTCGLNNYASFIRFLVFVIASGTIASGTIARAIAPIDQ